MPDKGTLALNRSPLVSKIAGKALCTSQYFSCLYHPRTRPRNRTRSEDVSLRFRGPGRLFISSIVGLLCCALDMDSQFIIYNGSLPSLLHLPSLVLYHPQSLYLPLSLIFSFQISRFYFQRRPQIVSIR